MNRFSQADQNNLFCHLGDGVFFNFGMSFIALQTILPVFLSQFGASPELIGAFPVLWMIGVNLPQLFVSTQPRNGYSKGGVVVATGIHRFMFLCIGLLCLLVFQTGANIIHLIIIFILLAIAAVFGGIPAPGWNHLFAKTIPVQVRGKMIAYRQFFGSLLGIASGWLVSNILARVAFPGNYGCLFVLAFLSLFVSLVFLHRVQEPQDKLVPVQKINLTRRALKLVTSDSNFRAYLIVDILFQCCYAMLSFLSLYGITHFHLPDSAIGFYTMVLMAGNLAANFICGVLADKFGHRSSLILQGICFVLCCLWALISGSAVMYAAVFLFASVVITVVGISRTGILLEMGQEQDRHVYVAAMNSISSPFVVVGVLQGLIIRYLGFHWLFIINGIVGTIALLVLLRYVREPRWLNTELKANH